MRHLGLAAALVVCLSASRLHSERNEDDQSNDEQRQTRTFDDVFWGGSSRSQRKRSLHQSDEQFDEAAALGDYGTVIDAGLHQLRLHDSPRHVMPSSLYNPYRASFQEMPCQENVVATYMSQGIGKSEHLYEPFSLDGHHTVWNTPDNWPPYVGAYSDQTKGNDAPYAVKFGINKLNTGGHSETRFDTAKFGLQGTLDEIETIELSADSARQAPSKAQYSVNGFGNCPTSDTLPNFLSQYRSGWPYASASHLHFPTVVEFDQQKHSIGLNGLANLQAALGTPGHQGFVADQDTSTTDDGAMKGVESIYSDVGLDLDDAYSSSRRTTPNLDYLNLERADREIALFSERQSSCSRDISSTGPVSPVSQQQLQTGTFTLLPKASSRHSVIKEGSKSCDSIKVHRSMYRQRQCGRSSAALVPSMHHVGQQKKRSRMCSSDSALLRPPSVTFEPAASRMSKDDRRSAAQILAAKIVSACRTLDQEVAQALDAYVDAEDGEDDALASVVTRMFHARKGADRQAVCPSRTSSNGSISSRPPSTTYFFGELLLDDVYGATHRPEDCLRTEDALEICALLGVADTSRVSASACVTLRDVLATARGTRSVSYTPEPRGPVLPAAYREMMEQRSALSDAPPVMPELMSAVGLHDLRTLWHDLEDESQRRLEQIHAMGTLENVRSMVTMLTLSAVEGEMLLAVPGRLQDEALATYPESGGDWRSVVAAWVRERRDMPAPKSILSSRSGDRMSPMGQADYKRTWSQDSPRRRTLKTIPENTPPHWRASPTFSLASLSFLDAAGTLLRPQGERVALRGQSDDETTSNSTQGRSGSPMSSSSADAIAQLAHQMEEMWVQGGLASEDAETTRQRACDHIPAGIADKVLEEYALNEISREAGEVVWRLREHGYLQSLIGDQLWTLSRTALADAADAQPDADVAAMLRTLRGYVKAAKRVRGHARPALVQWIVDYTRRRAVLRLNPST